MLRCRYDSLNQPDRGLQEFGDRSFRQEEVVAEARRPERVPCGRAAELRMKFDGVAVAYRKAMRELGLATSDAIGHVTGPARKA